MYAGVSRNQAAKLVGVVAETIGRWERGATTPEPATLNEYADALNVPRWFFHNGFEHAQDEPDVNERVEALENRYTTLENRIAEIIARELAAALAANTTVRATGRGARGPDHGPGPQEGSRL